MLPWQLPTDEVIDLQVNVKPFLTAQFDTHSELSSGIHQTSTANVCKVKPRVEWGRSVM